MDSICRELDHTLSYVDDIITISSRNVHNEAQIEMFQKLNKYNLIIKLKKNLFFQLEWVLPLPL